MQFKISVTGDLGSGKSTICDLLVEKSGAGRYSTGTILRDIAAQRGMSVLELNKYMESHPEIDLEIDNGLKKLSSSEENLIIDSRMAWHFTENTFKVYLAVDIEEAARRILSAERGRTETYSDLSDAVRQLKERRASEYARYLSMYRADCKNYRNFDLVIDTTYASPEEVADTVLETCAIFTEGGEFAHALLAPKRLLPLENSYQNVNTHAEVIKFGDKIYLYKGRAYADRKEDKSFIPCVIAALDGEKIEGVPVETYLKNHGADLGD